jgi:K+/H+ antiporter YhaU regulatory subunit KhtT
MSLDTSFRVMIFSFSSKKGEIDMKFRIHEVKLEDYQHLSDEVLLQRSREIARKLTKLLGLMWELEGSEREKVETEMDRLYIEDMKIHAVLSARENRPNNEHRY